MWMPIIWTEGEGAIEARADAGTIIYRARTIEHFGPALCLRRVRHSSPSPDLADHLAALNPSGAQLQAMALAPLSHALGRLAGTLGAPVDVLDRWRALLTSTPSQARAFHAAFVTLRDLLVLADERVRTRKRRKSTAARPVQLGQDDPQLSELMQRLLRVLTAPGWGEYETSGFADAPHPRPSDFIRAGRLFAWRYANIAALPLEDLDALLAHRRYLTPLENGRVALDLAYLLPLRERIEALAPWSDLALPPTDDVDFASVERGGQRWTLIRNERRWGVRADDGEPMQLAAGIGAQLARRMTRNIRYDHKLADDMRMHALAAESVRDPREWFSVSNARGRVIVARWWQGGWRLRSRRIPWSKESSYPWSQSLRLAIGGRGAAALELSALHFLGGGLPDV